MSLAMNDLRPGVFFIYEGQPYQVLEAHHLKMQQRRPVLQTKMKNLINGKLYERNFQPSDVFAEADIERRNIKFLYAHRAEYWFSEEDNPAQRFSLTDEVIGSAVKYLKNNLLCQAVLFEKRVINIELPVKVDLRVTEAPPTVRGNTAQGGVKQVILETGATLNVPLFINQEDVVRVNTQSESYVERVTKR